MNEVILAFITVSVVLVSQANLLGFEPASSFWLSEDSLRERALEAPVPKFPSQLASMEITGIVVAEIGWAASGRVISTGVLEAPSKELALAVKEAIDGWRMKPFAGGASWTYWSKVTFYFISDGKGSAKVYAPREVGYIGAARVLPTYDGANSKPIQ